MFEKRGTMRKLINDVGTWLVFSVCVAGLSVLTAIVFITGLWKEVINWDVRRAK